MKLKPIVASLCLLGMATAGTALAASNNNASVNAQIKSLQKQISQLQMKVNGMNNAPVKPGVSNVMSLNANLSQQMMSNYSGVGREMNLLKARQMGGIANQTLTVGGLAQADAFYQKTNTQGQFANPVAEANSATAGNNAIDSYSHIALSNVDLSATAALNSWATGYVQLGSYNIGENGTLPSSGPNVAQNSPQVEDAYLVFGNLAQNPVYGFVGKKDIDFGSFASISPYTQPLTRSVFMATGNTAGVGYSNYGFNGTLSVMNGGSYVGANNLVSVGSIAQYENLRTTNGNSINNYALNASYGQMTSGVNWNVGAGYLSGTSVLQTNGNTNGAWDLNAKASVNNFDLLGEYVSTAHGAQNYATGFENGASLHSWSLGGDYNFPVMGYKSVAGLEYSNVKQGSMSNGSVYQYVASYRVQPVNNVWTGLEYAVSRGVYGGTLNATQAAKDHTVLLDVTAYF